MSADQWRDLVQRATSTFLQGALAAAPVGPVADISALRSVLLSMAVGGLAAVLSAAQSALRARRSSRRPSQT